MRKASWAVLGVRGQQRPAAWIGPLACVWVLLLTGCASGVPAATTGVASAGGPTRPAASPSRPADFAGQTLTVYAASSLTDAFAEIGQAFGQQTGADVDFNFGGSNILRQQLEQGARADVFASANVTEMEKAQSGGLLAGPPVPFVKNRLTVILPKDNSAGLMNLHDLGDQQYKLVLAGPTVPVGGYARDSLRKLSADPTYGADFAERVLANLVSNETNVRQIVSKVSLGEADAGIVYVSDVAPAGGAGLSEIPIPDDANTPATYPLAVLASAVNPDLAEAFVEYVRSPAGQAILQRWGFVPVSGNEA